MNKPVSKSTQLTLWMQGQRTMPRFYDRECGRIVPFGAEETCQESSSPGWEGLSEPLPQYIAHLPCITRRVTAADVVEITATETAMCVVSPWTLHVGHPATEGVAVFARGLMSSKTDFRQICDPRSMIDPQVRDGDGGGRIHRTELYCPHPGLGSERAALKRPVDVGTVDPLTDYVCCSHNHRVLCGGSLRDVLHSLLDEVGKLTPIPHPPCRHRACADSRRSHLSDPW